MYYTKINDMVKGEYIIKSVKKIENCVNNQFA